MGSVQRGEDTSTPTLLLPTGLSPSTWGILSLTSSSTASTSLPRIAPPAPRPEIRLPPGGVRP